MGPTTIPARVAARVLSRVEADGECIVSTYSLGSHGYAQVGWHEDGQRTVTVCHRVAWIAANGPIPVGMVVDHICRNRRCLRLDHLQLLTHEQNCAQGGPVMRARPTCKRGHDLATTATVGPDNRRHCRACARERHHERKNKTMATEAGEGTAVPSPNDTEPTTAQIKAFKRGWHLADFEGRHGDRVRDGLRAVLNLTSDEIELHELFQQQHPGMTESHELYAELFEDWREEARS